MKIALVGPITPRTLNLPHATTLPVAHHFDMNSDLANELMARGHEVHVFTGGRVGKTIELTAEPHSVTIVNRSHRGSALMLYTPTIRALKAALGAKGPFDAVHAHWLYDYAAAALAVEPNALVTVHDWPERIVQLNPGIPTLARYLLSKWVAPKVRRATAPSNYMRRIAEEELKLGDTALVPNGFPETAFGTCEPRVRDNHNLLAINIGFDRRKNVSTLIEAYQQVRARFPDSVLTLVGPGYGDGEQAQQFAQAKGLSDGITFEGRVDRSRILALLAQSALMVHPSLEEAFGLVLIEAMSQGVAVLGGDNSGAVPWILDGGNAGFLTDVASPHALARMIEAVLSDRERLFTTAQAGWLRAKKEFTISRMTDRLEALYAEQRAL